jgi:hypothetical protein
MSWLKRYLQFTEWHEAPEIYHLWVGLAVISSALERRVWLDCEHFTVFPNFYIILVGRSGLRKSSAIAQGHDLLRCIPGHSILMEKITHGSLLVEMSLRCKAEVEKLKNIGEYSMHDLPKDIVDKLVCGACTTVIAPELTVFIGKDAYISGLIASLTSLYDCHNVWPYKTKNYGQFFLYKTCLNLLGATTPTGFKDVVPPDAVGLGFASRLVVVMATKKRKRKLFHDNEVKVQRAKLRKALAPELLKISEMVGPMELTLEAKNFMESWYQDRPPIFDERLESFEEREHALAFKLSMAVAAADKQRYEIHVDDIKFSLDVLAQVKENMQLAYEHIGDHQFVGHIDRVLAQIRSRGKVSWSNLLKLNWYHLTRSGLQEVIETLEESKHIKIMIDSGGKYVVALKEGEQ